MTDWLLQGEPRPVQIEALNRSYYGFWQRKSMTDENDVQHIERDEPARGWAHFLEQRLGKTPVDLNEFALFRRDHGFKWHVVVAPNQYKPEWGEEAYRFGIDCEAHVFQSDNRAATQRFIDRNQRLGGLIAVNYESLIYPDTLHCFSEALGDKTMITFDESISVKNHNGMQAKEAIGLAKECAVKRILTGKPVSQGPHDLWSQLRCIGELDGFNYYAFLHTFCKLGGFKGKKVTGMKNEDRLREEILAHCSFNARRIDWMKTPGREYAQHHIKMIREQQIHYDAMFEELVVQLSADVVISADMIITKLIKLAQISSGFIIDEQGNAHDIMPPRVNPKLQEAVRMIRDEIEGKVILMCHHNHSMNLLEDALQEFNPAIIRGAGWHKANDRDVQEEKRRFNGDPNSRVMIGQIQSIKFGHTLMGAPGNPCLNTIYYENNYSLNDRSQTEERNQGDGQQGMITIWDFIAAPIDTDTIGALVRKEDISAAVMGYARATGVLPPA